MKSLGIIEAIGLATGIEAMDAALKSANVELLGYEFCKGNGMTTIKIEGNVGAVTAAVSAANSVASKANGVFASKVIPRPSAGIDMLIHNNETVGYVKNVDVKTELPEEAIVEELPEEEKIVSEVKEEKEIVKEITCNLCKDPECNRKKGDPKASCIKFKK